MQLLYETLDTLIEALTAFIVSLNFVDRQIDKSKDQTPKHHYLGRKNYLTGYRRSNYFSRIGADNIYLMICIFYCSCGILILDRDSDFQEQSQA